MTGIVTPQQFEQQARTHYRESVHNGTPLTAHELAEHYGRTEAWARHLINDHHADAPVELTATGRQPAIIDAGIDIANDTPTPVPHRPIPTSRKGAYGISWTALLAGITVSIAGNILHAHAVSTNLAAWLVAAFWPIALFLAVEVITRVQWPHGFWYSLARYGGTGLVATVAGIVSYRHMSGLLTSWGEDPISSHLGPLAIDGLVVVAATALVAMNKPQH